MAYQALYRAWRPERFEDIVGQDAIVTTLVRQIEQNRISHAYLFCGSRGTGKTTTAKVLARAINCEHPGPGADPCGQCDACKQLAGENSMDVIEIDAASNNGVDEIRALRAAIAYPPSVGRYKVYIIDEVHMLSSGAFNALLKTLEEPPAHAVFILATTEPQKLPATILSRCQRYDFKRIPVKVIVARLKVVLAGIGQTADDEALSDIARAAEGGLRDALSLLDMCLAYGDGHVTGTLVRSVLGATDNAFLFDFADHLIACDAGACLADIDRVMNDGCDPAVFARGAVNHMRSLLMAQTVKSDLADLLEITGEDAKRFAAQAQNVPLQKLTRMMDLFMRAESDMKWASQPRAALELCAVRACHPEREEDANNLLLERIAALEEKIKNGVAIRADKAEKPAKAAQSTEKKATRPAQKADAVQLSGDDTEKWAKAVETLRETDMAIVMPLGKAKFLGTQDDVATLEFSKAYQVFIQVVERPEHVEAIEKALEAAYGRPIRLRTARAGASKPAAEGNRTTLTQAFDVFGRENVVVTDD